MELSNLFSSASKYRILRTLSTRNTPIHLRGLVELANVQLHSAQIAVERLVRDDVVIKAQQENRSMLSLNPRSQYATGLRAHFKAEEERMITAKALQYKNVSELLERIHELRMLSWRK